MAFVKLSQSHLYQTHQVDEGKWKGRCNLDLKLFFVPKETQKIRNITVTNKYSINTDYMKVSAYRQAVGSVMGRMMCINYWFRR